MEVSQGDGIQGKNIINIRFVVLGTKLPLQWPYVDWVFTTA